jgi:hypothetical protein
MRERMKSWAFYLLVAAFLSIPLWIMILAGDVDKVIYLVCATTWIVAMAFLSARITGHPIREEGPFDGTTDFYFVWDFLVVIAPGIIVTVLALVGAV